MALNTILASGTAAGSSSNVVIADGASKTVGLFVASGEIGAIGFLSVMMITPGADLLVTRLSSAQPFVVLAGPGTFKVVRTEMPSAVGVFAAD
jgi:hypothetical protein